MKVSTYHEWIELLRLYYNITEDEIAEMVKELASCATHNGESREYGAIFEALDRAELLQFEPEE